MGTSLTSLGDIAERKLTITCNCISFILAVLVLYTLNRAIKLCDRDYVSTSLFVA